MIKIIGVYNANSGFIGELSYVFGKIIGKKHCELCDITHGYKITGKKEWKECLCNSKIKIEMKHLNELENNLRLYVENNSPCILLVEYDKEGSIVSVKIIIDKEELKKCNKDPFELKKLIYKKIGL